jgi:hypothetical protein
MIRRRPWLSAFCLLALILLVGAGILGYFLKLEPAFYSAGARPNDYDTREKASRLLTRVQDLKNDIRTKSEWGETFTAEELNCFFAEMLTSRESMTGLLPGGFHSPRVAIEGDRLKLGVRYGQGFWSTVVWIDLRIWLVADETNLMAVEVRDLRAGQVGVGTQSILDAIADAARNSNIDVVWYRHNGNPVGLFRFFPDQPRPASQVLTLELREGKMLVAGRSVTEPLTSSPPGGIAP